VLRYSSALKEDKKFQEELIAYFSLTACSVSHRASRKDIRKFRLSGNIKVIASTI
jgi:hypothetical protein